MMHHNRRVPLVSLGLLLVLPLSVAYGQRRYPPEMNGAEVETYKQIGETELKVWIFQPPKSFERPRPAIVFFFGGGWRSGSPAQFEQHCRYLASHGMVAIAADYRVESRHSSTIVDSVRDAKSAISWVRSNADRLGIDPNRIVASGGSAGGHIAACTGVVPGLEEDGIVAGSSVPNALALFNPALMLAPVGQFGQLARARRLVDRMGIEATKISPIHHIRGDLPPTIIFHGKQDRTVPFTSVELYTAMAREQGNRCELDAYESAGHGFFNWRPKEASRANYRATLNRLHKFLQSLGYIEGEPTIQP